MGTHNSEVLEHMNLPRENGVANFSERNAQWKALILELEDSLDAISRAVGLLGSSTSERNRDGVEEGIRQGYCALHNRRALAETLGKHGLVKKWDEITTYAMLATSPEGATRQTGNTTAGFNRQMTEFLVALKRAARNDSTEAHPPGSHWQR